MTDPYAIGFLAFVLCWLLHRWGVWRWLWRRYVLQPTGHWWRRRKALWWGKWRPKPKRPPIPAPLRQHIFERDGNACRVPNRYGRPCGNRPGHGMWLEPHHWISWKQNPGLFYDVRNLMAACWVCNRKLGAKRQKYFRDWNDLVAIRAGKPGPIICRAHAMRGVEVQPDPRLVPNPR